jgi:hypothetical protein
MIMYLPRFGFTFGALCLLLFSTSCGGSTMLASANTANTASGASAVVRQPARQSAAPAQPFPLEVFDAESLPSSVGAGMVTIETDLPAEITVVAFPSPDIGLDYMTQGGGNSEQAAAAEAHTNVSVTLSSVTGGALIWARLLNPNANANDRVRLHVRVPHNTSLVVKATKGGDITVSGEVGSVHAHTPVGTITVDNVIGPLQLTTENGSINVDAYASPQSNQVQPIELHARNGDINLTAVGANVLAETTGGNIRFIGSLNGDNNSFATTGNGRVLAALPNDLTYSFDVENRQRVVNDFMPSTLICAMATSPDTRIWAQQSPDLIGQMVASDPVITTTTRSFKSVAGRYRSGNQPERPYLYFEDKHSQVTRFSPQGDVLPNGGNAAQAFWSPDCETVKQLVVQNAQPLTARLRIRAETGEVILRLIRKH